MYDRGSSFRRVPVGGVLIWFDSDFNANVCWDHDFLEFLNVYALTMLITISYTCHVLL